MTRLWVQRLSRRLPEASRAAWEEQAQGRWELAGDGAPAVASGLRAATPWLGGLPTPPPALSPRPPPPPATGPSAQLPARGSSGSCPRTWGGGWEAPRHPRPALPHSRGHAKLGGEDVTDGCCKWRRPCGTCEPAVRRRVLFPGRPESLGGERVFPRIARTPRQACGACRGARRGHGGDNFQLHKHLSSREIARYFTP